MEENKLIPSLKNIVDQTSLKWIFIAGEEGVGKTSISCSLAVLLSKVRENVIIISADSNNNLSEAFRQKFSDTPSVVEGFNNLYVMEIGCSVLDADNIPTWLNELTKKSPEFNAPEVLSLLKMCPGYYEIFRFSKIISLLSNKNFSVIIFLAGSIEKSLKFLLFPELVESGIEKLLSTRPQLYPFASPLAEFFGFKGLAYNEEILPLIRKLKLEFHNHNTATVICVGKAEISSLNKILCFIEKLHQSGIDTHNIVFNRVLFPDTNVKCHMCLSLFKYQSMCIDKIPSLFTEFHVTKLPLLEGEVSGTARILELCDHLVKTICFKII